LAKLHWGKVFYQDTFAGILQEEPGDCFSFEYDDSYIASNLPPISYSLPKETKKHTSYSGLFPFFDNLVAEGWLAEAQTRLLGQRSISRFQLLLAFGYDCIGGVSIMDPEPSDLSDALLNPEDPKELATLTSRASLSGVQPKLAIIQKKSQYFPVQQRELSTHIAKFPSLNHLDLVWNEYFTTKALKTLLPNDDFAEMFIGEIQGQSEPALIIKRFDRQIAGSETQRIHFEEFNQLLGQKSSAKYDGFYKNMSDFIRTHPLCLSTENYKLFKRLCAGILFGNTDMHFKNFALFHGQNTWQLTPSYDMVSASLYQYKTLALGIGGAMNLRINELKPKNILKLSEEFGISKAALKLILTDFEKNKEAAIQAIIEGGFEAGSSSMPSQTLKDQLIQQVEKRWKSLFVSLGKSLSKKP
jgi:serine/threonine-protein kinase HipA